ncbi:MAG: site-specific integrase [Acidobacteriota bacterium]|nr:site-specific integrase [Acidobacteriota bacterium]
MQHTGVKKLASGRYKARYFAGYDSKGNRRYPARTFDLYSEAVKWRTKKVNEKNSGKRFETHRLTVAQWLDQWLEIKGQNLRENSLAMYRQSLEAYVKPEIGSVRLARLRPLNIETMQAALLKRVSSSTVASARTLLYGAMEKAVELELIATNPVKTEAPKRNKPNLYAITIDDAMRLVDACEGSRFELCFILALKTGLRPEELLGLTWADMELSERGVVHVRRVVHKLAGGGWRWHDPKSKNGRRSIVFPGELAARLTNHRRLQLEQKMLIGQSWQNNDLVFCSSVGTPIRLCALHAEFKKILIRAKLPASIRIYDIRHFFITVSLMAGVDLKTVSREAGHGDVAFTLQVYGSVLNEMHETASDRREELFKSRKTAR